MANALPLEGIRVLDLTDEFGPLCGRLLADLGAEVVRIEPPGGASSRHLPPFAPDGTTSLWFATRNANKTGHTVDLRTSEGRDELTRLAAGADVLVESMAPGALEAIGVSCRSLQTANPSLVIASITPFGQTGPYAEHQATDATVYALSGNLSMSGTTDRAPLLIPGALCSDTAGVVAAFGIVAALIDRVGHGRGARLDISALEAAAQLHTWGLPNTTATIAAGGDPVRQNTRAGTSPVYPTFASADGMVRLVIMSSRQWRSLWEWMGSPEELSDPSWGDMFMRLQNLDVLNPRYAEFIAPMEMETAAEEAQRRGVVATPMLKPADVLANAHYASRATFAEMTIAEGVTGQVAAGFFELDGDRLGPRRAAPAIDTKADIGWIPLDLPTSPNERTRPLHGLRVLDFGHGGVGVECGRMLAEYGADVIKIETRTYPDFIRVVLGGEMTPSFASSSRSKRSFGVDAKKPEGREVLLQLAATADIVVENNSTGTMTALGIDVEALHAVNPDLVYVSSQMMGSRGAYADWIGYGPTIQSVGGLNWLWNFDDGEQPPGSNAIHPDHLAGRLCALAGLAGTYARIATGHAGCHIEIAQVEALINTLSDYFLSESLAEGSATPTGNRSERGAPWGVYRCAGDEQWVTITCRNDDDWANLGFAMASPEWTRDPRFATEARRRDNHDELDDRITEWTQQRSAKEAMDACQAQRVPAGAMLTSYDQLTDPHFVARGFPVEIDQPGNGQLTLEGPALYGDPWPAPYIAPAPMIGEHTRELCHELGLAPDQIEQLFTSGALEET